VRLAGLDPDRRYKLSVAAPTGGQQTLDLGSAWTSGGPVTVPGSVLLEAGVRLPVTAPESAYVLRLSGLTPGVTVGVT
jgi:alpha-galactosidase